MWQVPTDAGSERTKVGNMPETKTATLTHTQMQVHTHTDTHRQKRTYMRNPTKRNYS